LLLLGLQRLHLHLQQGPAGPAHLLHLLLLDQQPRDLL
jgi:hypothetical protein